MESKINKNMAATEEKGEDGRERVTTKVYVGHLSTDFTSEMLKERFGGIGDIKSAVVHEHKRSSDEKYGFVEYESPEDSQAAIEKLNNSEINGKIIVVEMARQPKNRRNHQRYKQLPTKTVYVKNISPSSTNEELKNIMSDKTIAPELVNIIEMTDEARKIRNTTHGFVKYATHTDAKTAVDAYNGRMLDGNSLRMALAKSLRNRRFVRRPYRYSYGNDKKDENNIIPPAEGVSAENN